MKMNQNELNIQINDIIFGYKVEEILNLNEIHSVFYLLSHKKTKAQHIHIKNNDIENTFGVAFKTIPSDSTGIAHILEHTVLCGSLKFQVKDPFFSMLKRSLSTFMNAFTSSDWTMYPFSTQNKKDYYNLMSVYLDSVFYPKITELSFKQEGYRIDFEDPKTEKRLVYKGIVYNEMKGAMSSPDQIMIRSLLNALYPDTTYSNNSGGNPADIPSLTHKNLKNFHKKHYHPSNAFFYTYGNLPLNEHLRYINNNFLSYFNEMNESNNVTSQSRWKKPKKKYYYFPLSKNENPNKKNQICLAWLMCDVKDTFEVLVISILEQILLGNAASPLRKALIDSNLGISLSDGTGFDSENRDTMFSCGLKDVEEINATKIENIIFKELNFLVNNGIDQLFIDLVLHKIEFNRKERTNIPYPFGIKLLLGISSCWFHGGNPGDVLQIDKDLNKIKEKLLHGRFFEKKIKQYFIDNNHRVLLILKPDQAIEENENKRIKKELYSIRNKMKKSDLEKIKIDSKKLDQLREKDEDLSCLPTLELNDIPKYINKIKPSSIVFQKNNILHYDQPTSGILYFYGLIGIGSLEKNLLPLIPFFCHAFSRVGTTLQDYTKIAQKIDLYTGGISLFPHARTMFNKNGICKPFISFSGKCLNRNKNEMISLIQETIINCSFNEKDRIFQLLLEYKSGIESIIQRNGHNLAISLASRNFSNGSYLNELWSGVAQIHFIKKTIARINNSSIKNLLDELKIIASLIFSRNNIKLAIIGEKNELALTNNKIKDFIQDLPINKKIYFEAVNFNLKQNFFNEGWITSTPVSFVAETFETVKMEDKDSPALSVISKIMRSMYLHKEIREKGGAYGAFAVYNSENGLFSFCSYRDPNIVKTLNIYKKAHEFLFNYIFKKDDIKEAILQVCAEIDKPDSPAIAVKKDFLRKTIGLDDDVRQKYKTKLLKLNKKDILNVAEKYFIPKRKDKTIVIISNEDSLNKAKKELNNNLLDIKYI